MELQTNVFENQLDNLSIKWPKGGSDFSSLEEMRPIAKSCLKCDLCQTRTNVVVEDGSSEAKLMLIGEGPGEQEDLSGIPFVGRAGQLLDKILEAAQIDRKTETYICNIVKCRPPNNRVPLPSETEACFTYLQSQIHFIKPQIILLLGATAVSGILKIKNPKITKLHGKWIQGQGELLGNSLIMPFYHPSYLLRNPTKEVGGPKWQAWEAIKQIKNKLKELAEA